jgi:ParB-like chromosome segregation protein Spo0J
VKVSKLKYNPDNPRKISPAHLDKLKKSIKDFPQMMELRPIVYDPQTMCVLGGNQRLAAIKALDMTEIPDNWVLSADKLSDKQKKEFILKDNIPLGEWDFAILETAFDEFDLGDMGIELPQIGDIENNAPKEQELKSVFEIIIEYNTENELKEAFDKFQQEGLSCRISIL